jgi:hypothetical protein
MPEIFLEIDKQGPGITDIQSNNISPMPYRRPNLQVKNDIYFNSLTRTGNKLDSYKIWQPQQSQQQSQQQQTTNYTPQQYYMTSTPPAMRAQNPNQIGLKQNNFLNDQIDSQYYQNINSSNHHPQATVVNDSKFFFLII